MMKIKLYSNRLVELRDNAGITQRQLADALKVTEHTVRNWEKGRAEAELQIWQVKALCQILRCSLDDLPDRFKDDQQELV
jgi:DNA-binding XRE family transcriptional regulator